MTITYSCVANGRAVLAELALTGGSYQEAAATVLRQALLKAEPATIIQIGSYVYHTLFIDGITYLCATDNGLDTMAPSAFLKKVSDIFTRNPLMSQEHFFPSNAPATDFQQILAQHMMEYNKNQSDNTVSTVKSQVTDVKNIMLRNIDKVLERETETASIITEGADDPQATTYRHMSEKGAWEIASGTGGLLAATAVYDGKGPALWMGNVSLALDIYSQRNPEGNSPSRRSMRADEKPKLQK